MQRNWDAETLFVNSSTSDESLLVFTAELVRQGREKPTFSAVLDFHYQLDDTTTVSYRTHDRTFISVYLLTGRGVNLSQSNGQRR